MSLAIYNGAAFVIVGGNAQPASSATVEVRRESDSALASIFSDAAGTAPIAQPGFVADANGLFSFYAAGSDGGYKITVVKGADTITLRNQALGNTQFFDVASYFQTLFSSADPQSVINLLNLRYKVELIERAARRARMYAAQNLV